MQVKLGITDRTVTVFIPDPASTDGSGKTGLTHADLTVSYTRTETDNDVVVTDVTSSLSTLTALTDIHTDWGVKEVSSTLAPGLYRLDIADAVFAAGAWEAVVYVMITSSAAAASPIKFQLVAFDPLDAMRMGMTALPNALPDNAGGLPVSDAGALDMDGMRADVAAILVDTGTTLDARIPAALGANGNMKADVRDYSGTAGTFSGGRPEVNASHWGGTAVASALVRGNVIQWTGTNVETPDTAGVPNVNMTYLNNNGATVGNIGNVFGTDFASNYDDTNNRWLVDVRRLGGTAVSANSAANWHTLYENDAQVSATELSDIASATKMKVYFGLALRKDAAIASDRATELAEINFNWGTGAGAYVSTTDANEALRDRGDAAWITATGFSTLDAAGVRTAVGLASANLDTQLGTLATAANLSTVAGYLDTEIAAILADTNELQTDWANGGRLDLLVDAILDDTGTSGVAIATATMQSIADETLKRGVSSVEDTANTTSLAAIILAILESSVSGTTWTIRKTGGTTFVTKTITTDAGADPITGVT